MSCIFQVLVHVSAYVLTQVTRAYTPFLQPRATADTRKLGHRACERHQPHTEHRHSSSQLRADQRRYLRQCTAEVSHREHRHNIEAQSTSAQIPAEVECVRLVTWLPVALFRPPAPSRYSSLAAVRASTSFIICASPSKIRWHQCRSISIEKTADPLVSKNTPMLKSLLLSTTRPNITNWSTDNIISRRWSV
jgi:hypothetical protein